MENLRGLTVANLLSWLGKRAEGVYHQINPFDNGATYNTVLQNRPPAPRPTVQPTPQTVSQPNIAQQAFQRGLQVPVLGQFLRADQGLVNAARSLVTAPYNASRLGLAELTHNQPAQSNALQQLLKDTHAAGGLAQ